MTTKRAGLREAAAEVVRRAETKPSHRPADADSYEAWLRASIYDLRAALAATGDSGGPYTVRKIEEARDDFWDVLDGSGQAIALCGEAEARRIAAALNRATGDSGGPEVPDPRPYGNGRDDPEW